ncbi:MAG TPA: acyl-CoA dehydratase activase [Syntrophomonadaceae bacterium]|nr:acyl-CoA dehydratase activase [Syntrophomonadaceae bacterium]
MQGIDLGSRKIKIVTMDGSMISSRTSYDTIAFYRQYGRFQDGRLHIDQESLGLADGPLTATGYGKMTIPIAGARQIPEIQAHVLGAVFQSGEQDFTLLDIGGQDTKVIQVREGRAVDFHTNDRCAAGSGRYLENMAAVLNISLEELSAFSQEPVELNSTCAIFAETEIIARILEGHSTDELAAGVNYALYRRIAPLLKKLPSSLVLLAGGGAKSLALQAIIAREMQARVEALPDPVFNGAIGCCSAEIETW